jgi:capsular polysaccharide biosynthesis protein
VSRIAELVAERLAVAGGYHGESTSLIERIAPDPFYDTVAENLSAGSQRRSIPNFGQLLSGLQREAPIQVFHGERMSPEDQVLRMRETRILIAQHGAGLTNMVWMRKGGHIVEILPDQTGPDLRFLFRDLALELGHSYVAVSQASLHAPVDVQSVVAALQQGKVASRTWG